MPALKLFPQMALCRPLGLPLIITSSEDIPRPHYLKVALHTVTSQRLLVALGTLTTIW